MGTAAVIVLGVVAVTIISVVGDLVSKIAQAKIKAKGAASSVPEGEIERLNQRLAQLEARLDERDGSVLKLQDEVRFVTRMLEDASSGRKAN